MILAAGNAVVASANNPDKLYSILMIVTGAAHLLLLGLGPIVTTRWSYQGAYGIEVLFLLCLLPFIWLMPQYLVKKAREDSKSDDDQQAFPWGRAIMVCLAMTIFFARDSALWGFAQEIGRRTGMEDQAIGAVLGMTGVIGLLGALAVAILNVRFGRLIPMISGLVVVTILSLVICLTSDAMVFSVGIVFWQAATFFAVPYIFGMAAELDPQGRVIAACGGCLLLGASLGPAIAGVLIDLGGYNAIAIFIAVAMTVAIALAVKVNHGLTTPAREQG
jgi:predicted MFS family arabinose efflux permease